MKITLDGQVLELSEGASCLDAVKMLYPEKVREVLAFRVKGNTLPLADPAFEGMEARSLTLMTEEGRRAYERSLRFILLLAIRQLYPQATVRVENSTQLGIYVTVRGAEMDAEQAGRIEARMRELIALDIPYEKMAMTRAEAMEYFRGMGETDKVRLLTYRPHEVFTLYKAGGLLEYFYGVMVPSTGYTPVFALQAHLPGLELALPDPKDPTRTAAFRESPQLMKTFATTARWAHILGCENLADLNELIEKRGIREFIRVNEALHEKSVADIAGEFAKSGAQLILIAGPSSSGKTTFANRLSIQLRVLGLRPMKVSMDDYYINRSELPLEEDGKPDLERVEALDIERLDGDLVKLLRGEDVEAPLFDFTTQCRSERTKHLRLEAGQPVIMEGIHALNDRLTADIPRERKFLIYVSALTTMNLDDHNRIRTTDVRLLRRIVRDHLFRGTEPVETMSMWDSVRRGEDRNIFPFQENADVMFNSTLLYELAVLKKYAYPMLMALTTDNPFYTRAHRLLKFLNYVQAADVEGEIPINSILREFIGGCCFYQEEG